METTREPNDKIKGIEGYITYKKHIIKKCMKSSGSFSIV